MSMNLNARCSSGNINLWQTPTQISYTILPRKYSEVKGVKAREALERYIEWIEYSTSGALYSLEELENAKEIVKQHIEYVSSFLEDKKLCVWVM